MKITSVKGTYDLNNEENLIFRHIDNTAQKLSSLYGYKILSTPIIEYTSTFQKTLGETSDIVTKEMYTFHDKNNELITLRPEGTACIIRSVISQKLLHNQPIKIYYFGPMFRYERPQKGRQRQFHQLGIELIGPSSFYADVEVMLIAWQILGQLNLLHDVNLEINTLGENNARNNFKSALVNYLTKYEKDLSSESKIRLQKNPLRILDSKDPKEQNIINDAPILYDFINNEDKKNFENILSSLQDLSIPYKINHRLVRGLDYYNHSVFEFTTKKIGSQNAILGGGRYDNLIKEMGGITTPAIGWAAGIERIALLINKTNIIQNKPIIFIVTIGDKAENKLPIIIKNLTDNNFRVDFLYKGNLQKKLNKANKINASIALILGEDEISQNKIIIKKLDNGEQIKIPYQDLINKLIEILH